MCSQLEVCSQAPATAIAASRGDHCSPWDTTQESEDAPLTLTAALWTLCESWGPPQGRASARLAVSSEVSLGDLGPRTEGEDGGQA